MSVLRARLREYVALTRLDRPIGILLLLWPVLWALWIAAGGVPPCKILLIFVLGTVLTRSAGCVINDFADRKIDPHVERTRERPLAAGRVSAREALLLFAVLMGLALLLVLQLDRTSLFLAMIAAGLLVTYPFFKRFFPAPQLYLGIAFGWGIPMAFNATTGNIPVIGWWLFAITVIWALIYDTFYAMVDREDDRRIGVRSSALLFGSADLLIIGSLQVCMLIGLTVVGRELALGFAYQAALVVVALLFARHLWMARHRERSACFQAFLDNQYVGLVMFVGIVLATVQT